MNLAFSPWAEFHRLELIGFIVPAFPAGAGVECLYTGVPTPALITGVMMGPVDMEVRVLDVAPQPPASEWEDVVELPVELEQNATIAGATQIPGLDTPWLGVDAGDYTMRVSSRGADVNYDLAVDRASQSIAVELWRATSRLPHVHRCRSRRGSERRAPNPALRSGARVGGVTQDRSTEEDNLAQIARRRSLARAVQHARRVDFHPPGQD